MRLALQQSLSKDVKISVGEIENGLKSFQCYRSKAPDHYFQGTLRPCHDQ